MFNLIRYVVVLIVGVGVGYWLGATESVSVATTTSVPSTVAMKPETKNTVSTKAEPCDIPAASLANTANTQPVNPAALTDPFEVLALAQGAKTGQTPVDTAWLEYLQQHYDAPTQQLLNRQTSNNQQLIRDFHQTEVDPHWANLTEQRLKDYYFLQPDQQFIQINKVHCRQNGCEISGEITKSELGPLLRDNLRQQPWTKGRSISFSRSSTEGGEKFYMLMTDLPKE